ncbi:MAG: hypothetical protein IPJ34_04550 [Myxococcales bacterium]|nr:hypothetical protein [Myxococcales bacterium]
METRTKVLEARKRPKKKAVGRTTSDKALAKERVLDRVLEQVAASASEVEAPAKLPAPAPVRAAPGDAGPLRVARVVAVQGRTAEVVFRGEHARTLAALSEDVEAEIVAQAMKNRDVVLVERPGGDAPPVVLGVVSARRPRELHLSAETITLEAAREVLVRSGKSALRLREDGDVELVGSRILAMSRGLFRIVGRMLRLN